MVECSMPGVFARLCEELGGKRWKIYWGSEPLADLKPKPGRFEIGPLFEAGAGMECEEEVWRGSIWRNEQITTTTTTTTK